MSKARTIRLVAAVACMASGAASAQQPVSPGQMLRGSLLNVRAPTSEGWLLAQANGSGMAFARSGSGQGESYVANVTLFPAPQATTPDGFLAAIKSGIEADMPADRYALRSFDVRYTEERGYPCVRVATVAEDRHAPMSASQEVLLQLNSLYCRHPKRASAGFMIGYSHRGVALDERIDEAAKDFMDGVQVPTTPGEL